MRKAHEPPASYDEYYKEISEGCKGTELWEYMAEWRRENRRR